MKFLGRARQFVKDLGSDPEGKVQYYNVECGAGHRLRGERTEGYQALRCPTCGDGIFILPRSPLPDPQVGAQSSRSKGARQKGGWVDDAPIALTEPEPNQELTGVGNNDLAGDEIIWDDPPGESSHDARRNSDGGHAASTVSGSDQSNEPFWQEDLDHANAPRSRHTAERDRPPRTAPGRAAAARDDRQAKPRNSPAAVDIAVKRFVKIPSRPTLVLISVALLVVTAFAWNYRRTRLREYPLVAEKGRIEGIPALEDGDFDKAHQLLSAAKAAVDALGGAVDRADEIRCAAEEAAIFVDLCPTTLEEMLEIAGRMDQQAWASKFDTLYKGRAILIDAAIMEEPREGGAVRYVVDYVILPPGGGNKFNDATGSAPDRYGLIDFTGFKLFELARPPSGTRVPFGARLASFYFDSSNKVWWVGLEPNSGAFMTHTKALEAAGWPRGVDFDPPSKGEP